MRFSHILAAAAAMTVATLASASANVITLGGGPATVTCTPDCQAIVGGSITDMPGPGLSGMPGMLSSMSGGLYEFSPSSTAEEALALNALAGTMFSGMDGTQTDTGGASTQMFSSMAEWLVLKIGNLHAFIFNSGGTLNITYEANGLRGGGLSHITEFGESDVVPVPGAIWLMGAGLAGLGFTRRRQAAK